MTQPGQELCHVHRTLVIAAKILASWRISPTTSLAGREPKLIWSTMTNGQLLVTSVRWSLIHLFPARGLRVILYVASMLNMSTLDPRHIQWRRKSNLFGCITLDFLLNDPQLLHRFPNHLFVSVEDWKYTIAESHTEIDFSSDCSLRFAHEIQTFVDFL